MQTHPMQKYLHSIAIICLAASLAYLSYAILEFVHNIPDILQGVEKTSTAIQPVIEQTEQITQQIPQILEEVAQVRKQIPLILSEAEAIRNTIPPILTEWHATRTEALPLILKESGAIRAYIPTALNESAQYRALVPSVLQESENIRAILPVTLDRVDDIVTQAQTIASSAGENAVTGFFTGIFKAPFELMKGVGREIFPSSLGMSSEDYKLVENKAAAMLAQSSVHDRKTFYSEDKSLKIDMEVKRDIQKEHKLCRELLIHVTKNEHRKSKGTVTACRNEDGSWTEEKNL